MVGIGSIIGTYKISEKIGEGGMGAVFKGVDQMLEREVAIKMLRQELARQPDVLERFRAEAVTLAKLNHPNIATLYNFLEHEGDYFMVMEFVPGNTIENIILKYGAITYERAIPLFCQALEGIDQAHRKGIIHRDLKPANVMILESSTVKVMDFGIARMLGSARLTRQGNVVGTVEYMSPEAIRGEEVDARSDIYSLGILLYEMLTGRLPFENTSEYELMRSQIEEAPPPPTVYLPNIPVAIEQAIMRSLAKKREARFQTAGEFRAVLLSSLVSSTSQLGNSANYSAPATRFADGLPQTPTGETLKGGTQIVNRNTPPQANTPMSTEEPLLPPTQPINLASPSQEIRPPVPAQETILVGGNERLPTTPQGTLILGDNQNASAPAPSNRISGTQQPPLSQAEPIVPPFSPSPASHQTQRFSGENPVQQPSGTQIVSGQSGQMNPPPMVRDSRDQFQPAFPPPTQAKKSNLKIFAGVGILLLVLAAAATAYFVSKNRNSAAPVPVQPAETTATEENSTPAQTDSQPMNSSTVDSLANNNASADATSANTNASTNPNAAKQRSRKDEKSTNTSGEDTSQADATPQSTPAQPETKAEPKPETKPEQPKENPSTTAAKEPGKKDEKKKSGGIGGFFKKIFGSGDKKDEKKPEPKKNP